jgi:ketosteroid isomerase-like protein
MRKFLLLVFLSTFATAAVAADEDDVVATIRQYVSDFNKGDLSAEASHCTTPATIIDDFAPSIWPGCREWAAAIVVMSQADGDSDYKITLGKSWNVEVWETTAYAVYPTQIGFKHKGKPAVEHGIWTFVLKKQPEGWRINAWARAAK